MDVDDIVRLLGTYYHDGGKTIDAMHGKDARVMVEDITLDIERIVKREEPLLELWENFKQSPDDYQSELMRLLDSLEDLHAGFEERLEDFYEAYDFGTENRSPVVRTDMVDEEDSDLYVRDLDTGLYSGTQKPNTGEEQPPFDESDLSDEDDIP